MVSIAVAPEATGNGVGTALVRAFETALREVSDSYGLNVLKSNATAIRFYERLGFERVGETPISWTLHKVLEPRFLKPECRAA